MKKNTNTRDDEFSWDKISIAKYYKILDILNDNESDDITKNVCLVSIILDKDEEEVWEMSLPDAGVLIGKLRFLNDFKLPERPNMKITLPGYELTLMKDTTSMTVAQYFDYQQFIKMPLRESLEKILSVFLIPKGMKYNEGYDIVDLQNVIRNHLPFVIAQSLLAFMLKESVISLNRSLDSFKKMLTKEGNEEERKELERKIRTIQENLERLCSIGSC